MPYIASSNGCNFTKNKQLKHYASVSNRRFRISGSENPLNSMQSYKNKFISWKRFSSNYTIKETFWSCAKIKGRLVEPTFLAFLTIYFTNILNVLYCCEVFTTKRYSPADRFSRSIFIPCSAVAPEALPLSRRLPLVL